MSVDIERSVMWFILMVVAITIHEFAHAISADRLGDPTPRSQGRISLNPIDHLDPLGTFMMVVSAFTGVGFCWGKPVMTNPSNFKHPLRDMMIVAACGPLSNLLQALVFAGLIQYNWVHSTWTDFSELDVFLQLGIHVNLWLMLFNMIPIPPLDGSKILYALLPADLGERYDRTMRQFGLILFILLVVTGATAYIIGPQEEMAFHFLADQR